jgi:hypothetical protein
MKDYQDIHRFKKYVRALLGPRRTRRVHYQLNGLVPVSVCKHMYMTLAYRQFAHDPKNMAVTGIYLLHKSWCKRQKNDHMIATLELYALAGKNSEYSVKYYSNE